MVEARLRRREIPVRLVREVHLHRGREDAGAGEARAPRDEANEGDAVVGRRLAQDLPQPLRARVRRVHVLVRHHGLDRIDAHVRAADDEI